MGRVSEVKIFSLTNKSKFPLWLSLRKKIPHSFPSHGPLTWQRKAFKKMARPVIDQESNFWCRFKLSWKCIWSNLQDKQGNESIVSWLLKWYHEKHPSCFTQSNKFACVNKASEPLPIDKLHFYLLFFAFSILAQGTWSSLLAGFHQISPKSGRSILRPGDWRVLLLCIYIPALFTDAVCWLGRRMILLQRSRSWNRTRVTQPELTLFRPTLLPSGYFKLLKIITRVTSVILKVIVTLTFWLRVSHYICLVGYRSSWLAKVGKQSPQTLFFLITPSLLLEVSLMPHSDNGSFFLSLFSSHLSPFSTLVFPLFTPISQCFHRGTFSSSVLHL